MKLFIRGMVLFLSTTAVAQEIYPEGCVPWVVHDAVAVLTNKKPLLVMVHNLSEEDIWVTHPTTHPNGGFSSRLQGSRWSALVLHQAYTSFALLCVESRPGHEQQIPCPDVLAICQWPKASFPEGSGVVWAGENMGLKPLQAYMKRLGFVLQ